MQLFGCTLSTDIDVTLLNWQLSCFLTFFFILDNIFLLHFLQCVSASGNWHTNFSPQVFHKNALFAGLEGLLGPLDFSMTNNMLAGPVKKRQLTPFTLPVNKFNFSRSDDALFLPLLRVAYVQHCHGGQLQHMSQHRAGKEAKIIIIPWVLITAGADKQLWLLAEVFYPGINPECALSHCWQKPDISTVGVCGFLSSCVFVSKLASYVAVWRLHLHFKFIQKICLCSSFVKALI